MSELEIPCIYDLEVREGRKVFARVYAIDSLKVDLHCFRSDAAVANGDLKRTNLQIETEELVIGQHDPVKHEVTYYQRPDGTLLSPWRGNTPFWNARNDACHRLFNREDAREEFEIMHDRMTPDRSMICATAPGSVFTCPAEIDPIPANEVFKPGGSFHRGRIMAAMEAYWKKACIIDGAIYGPSAGPAWMVRPTEVVLIDNARLFAPDTIWLEPALSPWSQEDTITPQDGASRPWRGGVLQFDNTVPQASSVRMNLAVLDPLLERATDNANFDRFSAETYHALSLIRQHVIEDYFSDDHLPIETLETRLAAVPHIAGIEHAELPSGALDAVRLWTERATRELSHHPVTTNNGFSL